MHPSWYRQFWPWFLVLVPLSAVIAGITTLIIANNNAQDMVSEDYYKKGKSINMDMTKLEAAEKLGITFELTAQQQVLQLVQVGGPLGDELVLHFYHPTLSERDIELVLPANSDGQYQIDHPQLTIGKWQLRINNARDDWRLQHNLVLPLTDSIEIGSTP